ncbi:MAG: hypothetical protein ACK5WN_16585 [Alphaproteobacteria bacterium]|jgi:hypothetical protein
MASFRVGDDGELCCPGCGSINLHHGFVKVFSRDEDQTEVVVTTVSPASREAASVTSIETTKGHGNPSARRHGLRIRFTCELCPGVFDLTFAQHKGTTYAAWSDPLDK